MNNNVAVFGILPSLHAADKCLGELKNAGFRNTDVSILIPDENGSNQMGSQNKRAKASNENKPAGGTQSALADTQLEWLSGAAPLTIQGSGAFVAAGPVKSVLATFGSGGGSSSAGADALVGGLTRFGVSERDAKRFESQLKVGNILMACHCDGIDWVNRAKDALQRSGAEDVTTSTEVPADYMKAGQQSNPRSFGASR